MQPQPPVSFDALPEDAILVHVGPHKTGTTAIQSTLAQSRAELARFSIRYPGSNISHHHEARALIQRHQGWKHDGTEPPPPEDWTRFAERIRGFSGRVVISSEFLAETDEPERRALVRDLGADRVHIIAGARNPASIAVSNWQQVVRTYGRSEDLDSWLETAFRRDSAATTNRFWQRVDTAALVNRWLDVLPAERITVVALAEGDRRLLPATFEQLLGLPEGLLVDHEVPHANRGLTAVELTMIRRINELLEGRLGWEDYSTLMRGGVIPRVLGQRTPGPDEGKVPLPAWALEQAGVEAERNIAGLQASGVRIAGDLASLRKAPAQVDRSAEVTQVPLDLAVQAVVGAVLRGAKNRRLAGKKKPKRRRSAASRPAGKASPTATAARNPRDPAPRTVDDVRTRELATIVAHRVRERLRRTIGRTSAGRTAR